MAVLSEVLEMFYIPRNTYRSWHRLGALRTAYEATTQGVPAELTRENCLELGFMRALTKLDISPADSGRIAELWMIDQRHGLLQPLVAINPVVRSERQHEYTDPEPDDQTKRPYGFLDLATQLSDEDAGGYATPGNRFAHPMTEFKPATVIAIIDRAEIVRRVEQLFQE